ncbi:MAG: preprotein translocase subunit SecY [Clostridia bacterium]|nr:preprotein translocase subunit SecY [Clostridia bacterium]
MLENLRKIWNTPELRKKILYTFAMLLIYRLVGVIPAPGVDPSNLVDMNQYGLLQLVNMMTGNAFSQMTIMAMGITPYINASIIMQLLCIAIPALERMQQDETGAGREKISRITRYVTVGLAALQAIGIVSGLGGVTSANGNARWVNMIMVGLSMAGGSALAMWIGERITDKGVGNGISLLIFVGIVSNLFNGIITNFTSAGAQGTTSGWVSVVVIFVVAVLMTIVVTFVELAERRIPLQIAKQTKGRRVYGGQNTRLTLKVVSVGVMPLIFAYSFLAFPGTIAQMINSQGAFTQWWNANMSNGSVLYIIISALLIIAFTYFYSSISFDPKKQAEQLIMQGATIPGQRSQNIARYLQSVVGRLNLFAALYLAVLAAVPSLLTRSLNMSVPFAASSILIAVSVALETIRTIEGEMSIRGVDMDVEKGGFM